MYELEEDEELWKDFVLLDCGNVLTNGSNWENIIFHLVSGRKVYHRYNRIDLNDQAEEQWRKDSIIRRLSKGKERLLVMEQLLEGDFFEHLNELKTPDEDEDEDFGPEDKYYDVWYLKPLNNQNALSCLKKDNININSMRRWLDEQRTVITASMGEDIRVD